MCIRDRSTVNEVDRLTTELDKINQIHVENIERQSQEFKAFEKKRKRIMDKLKADQKAEIDKLKSDIKRLSAKTTISKTENSPQRTGNRVDTEKVSRYVLEIEKENLKLREEYLALQRAIRDLQDENTRLRKSNPATKSQTSSKGFHNLPTTHF
eukprot:TRINITY_DN32157_c0_g1_i1.p1 TRINITY_DN32157_c0_g1~~TRINITY_DN32157_c0_g1_i1.p1  ORF type:complete len:154 (+),score=28.84 TRINITY_DN32157_c0_g1_i1:64-525(+)